MDLKGKNSSRRLRRFTLIIIQYLRKSARSAGNNIITDFKHLTFCKNASKRATYKPRFPGYQKTKLYTVENQLYLSGH